MVVSDCFNEGSISERKWVIQIWNQQVVAEVEVDKGWIHAAIQQAQKEGYKKKC